MKNLGLRLFRFTVAKHSCGTETPEGFRKLRTTPNFAAKVRLEVSRHYQPDRRSVRIVQIVNCRRLGSYVTLGRNGVTLKLLLINSRLTASRFTITGVQ